MKTLLLTLVVVTIMCLDLGYTLVCYTNVLEPPGTLETCPDDFTCVKKWEGGGRRVTQYCSHACAIPASYEFVHCCQTDKCNG
uniref:Three-finger toxin MicTx3 n=1 Tax=Micrurus corallinus TaxID=54390 RepID=3SX3_MICCO|nr:RecName: Full=Three-finger toxin MicTx3; AltName: Full=MCOR0100C; AltName: Full=Three-finger toxin 3FTx-3; Flags: Precursor [Micrurus corallinus]ACS74997.1 3FTx precursor [Micrurus corallinus]